MNKIRNKSVKKVHAKNLKTLAKTGAHKGINQHRIGKPKLTEQRKKAANIIHSTRTKRTKRK